MNQRVIAKKFVNIIVKYGVGVIVHGVIQNNVNTERIDHKIASAMASYVLAEIVQEATERHTDKTVDDIFDAIDKIRARF